jgi:hypothetical protein
MNKTQQCSDCGFELQPEFRFCPGCGFQIIISNPDLSDILLASSTPVHIDKLAELTGLPIGILRAELLQKELTGDIKQLAGGMFKWTGVRPTIETTFEPIKQEKRINKLIKQEKKTKRIKQEKKTKSDEVCNIDLPPSSGVTIEFRYSSSMSYEFAVQEASKFPTYKEFGSDKKKVHRVSVTIEELEIVANLIDLLKGFRNRSVFVDGIKTLWDNVFSFMGCLNRKRESFKPELYCFGYENAYSFNVFGCIHTGTQLFCYGKWLNDEGDWEFDKERMRFELLKKLHQYKFCPALNLARIEDVLTALPNIVNPIKDKNWKFVEMYGSDSTSSGLSVKVEKYGMEMTITARGVELNGNGGVIEIDKKLKFKIPMGGLQTE